MLTCCFARVRPCCPKEASTLTRRTLLRRSAAAVAVVTGILQVQGCARPAAGLPPIEDPVVGEYHLGPGDQVRIITFGEEQLTGEFRVDASGDIALPLVGNVHAAGTTPSQLEAATKEVLIRSRLYKNPSVSVEVVNYRPVFILGEVTRPGQVPLPARDDGCDGSGGRRRFHISRSG